MTTSAFSSQSSSPGVLASLTTEQQDQLSHILDGYLSALERGEKVDRGALLQAHPSLAEVLALYLNKLDDLHDISAGFHNPTARDKIDESESENIQPNDQHRLGDFLLIRQIGRGGMGVVYEAEQVSLHRRVAIKLLPFAAILDANQIARFKHEAQAAAQLHHPNIVPVYAVGEQRGVHYYAMQLIVGHSLEDVIEQASSDEKPLHNKSLLPQAPPPQSASWLRAALMLGAQAADALHAAHESGIVHRDIKPSNLLVDSSGKLWVTDFGLARCQSDQNLTRTGDLVGTMRYMSPEQARGQSVLVDHRSDIYSLGATLYELIALQSAVVGEDTIELLRNLEQQSPIRLKQLCPNVPVDLETVIGKAMSKLREDRYWSAAEFAADLRRVIHGEPTLARPPSLTQRTTRWIANHRRGAALSVLIGIFAIVGLATSNFLIAHQKRITEENIIKRDIYFHQAHEAVEKFGSRLAEQLSEVPGAENVRRQLLWETLEYYRDFAAQAKKDPNLVADLALTYSKIGALTDKLGSTEEAVASLDTAEKLFERLVREQPTSLEHPRHLAVNLNNLALIRMRQGEQALAMQAFDRAISIQQRLITDAPQSVPLNTELAMSLNNRGLLLAQRNEEDAAIADYEAGLNHLQSALQLQPHDRVIARRIANVSNNLSALKVAKDPAEAVRLYQQAIDAQLKAIPEGDRSTGPLREIALTYNNLGAAETRQQRWSEAENHYQRAIEIQTQLVAIAPSVITYRRDLAVSLNNLGLALHALRNLPQAAEAFKKAFELQKSVVDKDPKNSEMQSSLGSICNNLALVREADGELREAAQAYEQAIQHQTLALDAQPQNAQYREHLSKPLFNLSRMLRELKQPKEAAETSLRRRGLWPKDPNRLKSVAEELILSALLSKELGNREEELGTLRLATETLRMAERAGLDGIEELLRQSPFMTLQQNKLWNHSVKP